MNTVLLAAGAVVAVCVTAFLTDRVLLAMEARGWIYWRRTKSLSSIGVDLIQDGDPGAQTVKRAMEQERVRKNVRPAEDPPFHVDLNAGTVRIRRAGRDAILRGTAFGPTQVRLHQISVNHLLGDAGTAIEHARHVQPAALPTTERQARYWIDVARAFDQWGKPDRCYRALLAAEHAAPQEVRRASVRTIAADLMQHDRALPGVRAFATRIQALA
ncbi:hypothetical protein ABZ070_25955 [Streptomyces sp. NPDC006283]|uniref:hypothetical protein n=1 Tax=Streptomyces sp. NPDC006283 TaxID=3156741 RepID=UPI0033B4A1FE